MKRLALVLLVLCFVACKESPTEPNNDNSWPVTVTVYNASNSRPLGGVPVTVIANGDFTDIQTGIDGRTGIRTVYQRTKPEQLVVRVPASKIGDTLYKEHYAPVYFIEVRDPRENRDVYNGLVGLEPLF